jgi:hypothetical protein
MQTPDPHAASEILLFALGNILKDLRSNSTKQLLQQSMEYKNTGFDRYILIGDIFTYGVKFLPIRHTSEAVALFFRL